MTCKVLLPSLLNLFFLALVDTPPPPPPAPFLVIFAKRRPSTMDRSIDYRSSAVPNFFLDHGYAIGTPANGLNHSITCRVRRCHCLCRRPPTPSTSSSQRRHVLLGCARGCCQCQSAQSVRTQDCSQMQFRTYHPRQPLLSQYWSKWHPCCHFGRSLHTPPRSFPHLPHRHRRRQVQPALRACRLACQIIAVSETHFDGPFASSSLCQSPCQQHRFEPRRRAELHQTHRRFGLLLLLHLRPLPPRCDADNTVRQSPQGVGSARSQRQQPWHRHLSSPRWMHRMAGGLCWWWW